MNWNKIKKNISTDLSMLRKDIGSVFKRSEMASYRDVSEYYWDMEPFVDVSRQDIDTNLQAYQRLLWIFAGVREKSSQGATVPLKIWNSPAMIDEVEEHPVNDLLDNPNDVLTRYQLFEKTHAYLELAGNCYWMIEKEHGLPSKIHVPRPSFVGAKLDDKYTGAMAYMYAGEKWSQADVVHFRQFNPLNHLVGYSTVSALEDSAILELYEITYGQSWYKNAIKPSLLFRSRETISDPEYERFLAAIRRVHQGVGKQHNIDLIQGDIDQMPVTTEKPTDGEYVKIRELNRTEILSGLGCYHLVAMLQGEATRLQEYKRMFWESLLPGLTNIQQTITKELLRLYPRSKQYVAQYDVRQISGLRPSLLEESLAFFRLWQMGVKTSNEIRHDMGISGKVDWGDDPPPSIPYARSKFMPNEERGFTEAISPHVEALAEDIGSRVGGNGKVMEEEVKQMISKMFSQESVWLSP